MNKNPTLPWPLLFNNYTSVSRLISTEPSELLGLQLSEPIASESALSLIHVIFSPKQDFQVDVYFRQRWVDHRLAFEGQEAPVILSARSIEKIWVNNFTT